MVGLIKGDSRSLDPKPKTLIKGDSRSLSYRSPRAVYFLKP